MKDQDEERILLEYQDPDTPENPRNQVMHLTKSLVNKPGDVSRLNDASRFLTRFLRRIETRIIAIPVAQEILPAKWP